MVTLQVEEEGADEFFEEEEEGATTDNFLISQMWSAITAMNLDISSLIVQRGSSGQILQMPVKKCC